LRKRLSVTIRLMLLVLEMMLRMTMRIHFTVPSGSMRVATGKPIVGVAMVLVLYMRRSCTALRGMVIVVMMHVGVHAIRMNSVVHRRLTTVVKLIVLWVLLMLELMA